MRKGASWHTGISLHKMGIGGALDGLPFRDDLWAFYEGLIGSFLVLSIVLGSVIAVVIHVLHRKARVNRDLENAFLAGLRGRSGAKLG